MLYEAKNCLLCRPFMSPRVFRFLLKRIFNKTLKIACQEQPVNFFEVLETPQQWHRVHMDRSSCLTEVIASNPCICHKNIFKKMEVGMCPKRVPFEPRWKLNSWQLGVSSLSALKPRTSCTSGSAAPGRDPIAACKRHGPWAFSSTNKNEERILRRDGVSLCLGTCMIIGFCRS